MPVVSGNVSLYNDTNGRSILPTPVVGCVGLVADVRLVPRAWQPGDKLFLGRPGFAGRLRVPGALQHDERAATAARPRRGERHSFAFWRVAPGCSLVHDVSDGGLAVALAEAALWSGAGAKLDLPDDPVALFGEGGGQGDPRGIARGSSHRARGQSCSRSAPSGALPCSA